METHYKTRKEVTLIVSVIMGFVPQFLMAGLNVALPTIGKEMQAEAVALSWIATSGTLMQAIFMVPFGRLGDLFGRKKLFFIGCALFIAGCVLSIFSNSPLMLIICMAGIGFSLAVNYGTVMAITPAVYPLAERGKALGIISASVYTGLSLGPLLGGFLTQTFGWRSIFVISALMGVAALFIGAWKLKDEWCEAKGEKFDYIGTGIFAVALLSIMYGFSQLPTFEYFFLVLFGVLTLVLFGWWELRTKHPIIDLSLFRNSIAFTYSNLATLINYLAIMGIVFMLSLYLQYIKGFSPTLSGIILIAQPVMMALLSPFAGRLSDRIDPRIVSSFGMCLSTIGLAMLIFIDRNTPMPYIVSILIIQGVGNAFFASPNTNAVMSAVDKRYLGIASATMGTMRSLGQVLSMGVIMILFSILIGKVEIKPESYDAFLLSFRVAFIIFAVFCLLGVFTSLSRGQTRK